MKKLMLHPSKQTRIASSILPFRAWLPALLAISTMAAADNFPAPYNSHKEQTQPMPAAEAAAKFTLPPGFKATVFASEPDVQNPIAMTWDGKGRLWVAENYTYAEPPKKIDLSLRDRILIFEDKKGDGHFSSRKVFTDNLQALTSIEVGHGGVWAMCPPNLLFIPDRKGADAPDSAPEVVLDGFTIPAENYHNFANGLRFGPDGWLYGRVGGSAPGEIGAPGTPADQRVPVRGGIWRYHPERKVFENVITGLTNPWGHDWNADGELFNVNTVNGHFWHAFAGAHFARGSTQDSSHIYQLIDMHADHWHFDTGKKWTDSRGGAANAYGGGHSHIGAMFYLGDNWPAEYRGRFYTLNQHGRRANEELVERTGSGYVAHRGQDTMFAADPWFVGIDLSYGPDGGVFVLDWSDTGECHGHQGVDRTSGRIFKVTYGDPKPVEAGDFVKLSATELVGMHTRLNEWFSRRARVELASRAATGQNLDDAKRLLRAMFDSEPNYTVKLRALWTLFQIGGADEAFLKAQLHHPNEHVRTWAIRMLTDTWPLDTATSRRPTWRPDYAAAEAAAPLLQEDLVNLARQDWSGLVHLALASTLQRLPLGQRAAVAEGLVSHRNEADDHNLPLMIWYGLVPVADSDPGALVNVAAQCEMSLTRKYIARRLTEYVEKNPKPLDDLLKVAFANPSQEFSRDILAGMAETLAGWRKAPKPPSWDALAQKLTALSDPSLSASVRQLSVVFGDGRALDELKKVALDNDADMALRKSALQTLIDNKSPDLRKICETLLSVRFINPIAARGLASFTDPSIGDTLVKAYKQFHPTDRAQLLATLVSRPSFAGPLLKAVGEGKIPRTDITPFHARQIRAFKDPELDKQLSEVWGEVHESAADKVQFIAKLKKQLSPAVMAKADLSAGRLVFSQTCAVCHRLYGEGADVGPDLTGSGRANLDYLLENVVDPSAVVAVEYRLNIVNLKDGRVLSGFITGKSDRTLTLKTMTEKLTLDRADISGIQEVPQSLMPEGLLQSLGDAKVRDLLGYLMHPNQVPLPTEAPSATH